MGENWEKFKQATILNKEEPKKDIEPSFVIGEPKAWSQINEEDNHKQWIWENYIAKGHITLLSALWKAGKSTLLRHLFLTVYNEEEFGGQPTYKSKILVISEENEGEWLSQKEELDPEEIDHVLIWSRPIRVKPNLKQWVQFIEEITERCKKDSIDLVVIDTLSTFWPIDNENDSAQVLKALVPLYNFTENNIGVLLVHHFRKGGGDQAQASRGSGALPGFVDNIIEFTRSSDGFYTQRILTTYGRFDAVIPTVVIELNNEGKYITKGEPWQVSKSARLEKIISIFRESKEALSTKEVLNLWIKTAPDISRRSIQNYIKDLENTKVLSSVNSRLEGKKKIELYALTGEYQEQTKMAFTPPMIPFVSSTNITRTTDESGLNSLSSVDPQFVPPTDETKGISPKATK